MALTYLDFCNYLNTVKLITKDHFIYNGSGVSPTAFGYIYATDTNTAGGLTGNKPRGFYFDLFGGGGNVSTFQQTPSLTPNGNNGEWEARKRELAEYWRTYARLIDADFYTSTENCEEGLIGVIDIHHLGGIGSSPTPDVWGAQGWSFNIVYSLYQCFNDLSVSVNDGALISTAQDFYYAAWVNAVFHITSGHLCINNGARADGSFLPICPVFPVTFGSSGLYITMVLMRSCIDKMDATPMIRNYMRGGFRMRPLPASWEGDYMDSGKMLATYLATAVSTDDISIYVSSSVWVLAGVDDDYPTIGALGIVITSAHTADVVYNIYMQAEAYDLDPTRVHVLYERIGAVRTELKRFTDVLDYDYTIVFDFVSAPCVLLEVVQL